MSFDSGSLKLRCALGFGLNGSRPSRAGRGFLPCASSSARRALSRANASASSACLPLADHGQPLLATLQLLRQLTAAAVRAEALVLGGIDALNSLEQRSDVLAQGGDLCFQLQLLLDPS